MSAGLESDNGMRSMRGREKRQQRQRIREKQGFNQDISASMSFPKIRPDSSTLKNCLETYVVSRVGFMLITFVNDDNNAAFSIGSMHPPFAVANRLFADNYLVQLHLRSTELSL